MVAAPETRPNRAECDGNGSAVIRFVSRGCTIRSERMASMMGRTVYAARPTVGIETTLNNRSKKLSTQTEIITTTDASRKITPNETLVIFSARQFVLISTTGTNQTT